MTHLRRLATKIESNARRLEEALAQVPEITHVRHQHEAAQAASAGCSAARRIADMVRREATAIALERAEARRARKIGKKP